MTELRELTEQESYDYLREATDEIMKVINTITEDLRNKNIIVSDASDTILSSITSVFLTVAKAYEKNYPDAYNAQDILLSFFRIGQQALIETKHHSLQ